MAKSSKSTSERKELSGWKQIAKYLGVAEPTARKYAQNEGLPIRKRGGRYYGFADEINAWKVRHDGRLAAPEARTEKVPQRASEAEQAIRSQYPKHYSLARPSERGLLAGVLVVGFVLTVAVLAALWQVVQLNIRGMDAPEGYELDDSKLWILDAEGRRAWSVFVHKPDEITNTPPLFVDIDSDGRNEVIYNYIPRESSVEHGKLLYFDHDGETIWEYTYGSELTAGSREFSPYYVGSRLQWLAAEPGQYILTVAHHASWYPCQVTLINPSSGEVVSEYWHPGWIYAVANFDVGRNGTEELLVGGANNPNDGTGIPGLAVLSIPFSEPVGEGNFFGSWNQRELKYLVFPKLDVFEVKRLGFAVQEINVLDSHRLEIVVGRPPEAHVYYYLDQDLRVTEMALADFLVTTHRQLFLDGLLDHDYSPRELVEDWGRIAVVATAPDGNSPEVSLLFEPW